jgi:GNAT superfamily N-acetyltransferase
MNLVFSFAKPTDAKAISELVNSAYRGDSSYAGWTTEADILDGQRTSPLEIEEKIAQPGTLIVTAYSNLDLVGTCELNIDKQSSELFFGMFSIKPSLQNKGIGRLFITHVEKLAAEWNLRKIKMSVITVRTELIEYYKRRGYQVTNEIIPFPTQERFGIPKVDNLEMVYLIKEI